MKTEYLKLSLEKAIETFKNSTESHKKLLINLYGKEHFLTDIKDRVTDYASACVELGISPLTIHSFTFLQEEDQEQAFARHQISIVAKALREGWKPDFTDSNYKYYVYTYLDTSKNGFSSAVSYCYRICYVGSDLLYTTRELAEYALKIMEKQYLTYLIK